MPGRGSGVHVELVPIDGLRIHPLNRSIYGPLDPGSPRVAELAVCIHGTGRVDPLRLATDGCIVSGNTRWLACRRLRMAEVPVIREEYDWDDPRFAHDLAAHNKQRRKTPAVMIREAIAGRAVDPDQACWELLADHRERADEAVRDAAAIAPGRRVCPEADLGGQAADARRHPPDR